MTTLLVKSADRISTDDHQRELPEGGLFVPYGFTDQARPENA